MIGHVGAWNVCCSVYILHLNVIASNEIVNVYKNEHYV